MKLEFTSVTRLICTHGNRLDFQRQYHTCRIESCTKVCVRNLSFYNRCLDNSSFMCLLFELRKHGSNYTLWFDCYHNFLLRSRVRSTESEFYDSQPRNVGLYSYLMSDFAPDLHCAKCHNVKLANT